jgi:hypothetical protein
MLLGMAINCAGLRGKEVRMIGKNKRTFGGEALRTLMNREEKQQTAVGSLPEIDLLYGWR